MRRNDRKHVTSPFFWFDSRGPRQHRPVCQCRLTNTTVTRNSVRILRCSKQPKTIRTPPPLLPFLLGSGERSRKGIKTFSAFSSKRGMVIFKFQRLAKWSENYAISGTELRKAWCLIRYTQLLCIFKQHWVGKHGETVYAVDWTDYIIVQYSID